MRNCKLPSLPLSCTGCKFYWLDDVNWSIVSYSIDIHDTTCHVEGLGKPFHMSSLYFQWTNLMVTFTWNISSLSDYTCRHSLPLWKTSGTLLIKEEWRLKPKIVWETQKWHQNFGTPSGSSVIDWNNILHILIYLKPTELMPFLSFLDNWL